MAAHVFKIPKTSVSCLSVLLLERRTHPGISGGSRDEESTFLYRSGKYHGNKMWLIAEWKEKNPQGFNDKLYNVLASLNEMCTSNYGYTAAAWFRVKIGFFALFSKV